MTKISATVVADSVNEFGDRITSMVIVFPRFILAEFNTHRAFSRNSASSRAIPTERLLNSVRDNPFVPIAFQKEHTGMQGYEYFTDPIDIHNMKEDWLGGMYEAVFRAKYLLKKGLTKQLCNRLIEPFMWHTVLVTATEWENFFELRCPQYKDENEILHRSKKDYLHRGTSDWKLLDWLKINKGAAEIHMMALAEAMWDAMNESKPVELKAGQWHIPFKDKLDNEQLINCAIYSMTQKEKSSYHGEYPTEAAVKISTAMCARTSYTVVGDEKEITYDKLISIHDRMKEAKPFHASPFEHCARAMNSKEHATSYSSNYPHNDNSPCTVTDEYYGWCRNFKGWIQYRAIIENSMK